MGDNFAIWQNVLIKWVNSLDLQDTPIQNISELGDGKFFYSLLNVISHKKKHGSSIDEADKAVTEFLKYEYPFYVMESKSCEMEDLEIMYVTSLLMLHCVLESQNKNIMEHMYKLDDETQVYIKNFFETIMQYDDNNITRNVVKHAVSQCGNNKSLKETMKGHSTASPLIGFSTPKRPPIMDVVQSPLAQKLKQLSEQRTVIERLNNDLDAEQAEKVMLQEQLQQERDKTKKLTRQLIDRKDEMKKLHEEWLYNDSESNQKAQCGNSCQEALLKKQIKDLETYISSLHGDIDILHNKQDLLQQRILKAEHQYQVWYSESQQNEALCEKLKLDAVEKECELAHTKELCSELQRHVQEIKQVHNISVEEDPCFTSPGCRTPENLCQAVIDLRLQEQLEENKIIIEQLKKLLLDEEVMKKQICDLQIRSETTEREADTLKATNLELQGKVDKMEALQHEFEECRMKQAYLSQELDVLSQIYAEEGQARENDVRDLKSELRNAEVSRDKLKQDYSTSETERKSMLALKIKLEKKINILNVEIADVKSSLLLLKEQQENLIATHKKQFEKKEETICQLVKKFNVLQDEIYSLEDEKSDLCTQLHAANSGLSELQMCKEHLLQLCNNMKDRVLPLTKISLDRKVEELLHEMNTVIEELEKVKAPEFLLQKNKLCLLEQHSEKLQKREEKINGLLKVEQCLNEEKKKMNLMQTQMNEFMCERKIVSELCSVLRENVSSLQAVVVSVQDQNTHEERDIGQKVLISKTEHVDGICKESIGDGAECLHISYDSKMRLPAEQWSSYFVTDISVYIGKLGSKGDESAINGNLLEKSSDLPNSQNLCLEEEGIPLEAELAALKISISELQTDHNEDIDTNVSKVVNNLEILNADLVSTRGEIMQILKSNGIFRNTLSYAKEMCHDIAQKNKDLTIRIEILNSENTKLLKDIEELENLKSLMEINERALAAERSLNAELKADKEAFGELYIRLKDDFQKLNTERESLNILIGTMKNQTLNLQKHNLELNEKLQKYEVSHLTYEENWRKLRRMREERHEEFNGLLNSETVLRQKMADFQRSFKDISNKFETIVLGTAASYNELKLIDCQRTKLEELLTLMCIECEEILHSILKWTYSSLQETEQNVEDQYLGISVYLGANEPPESVLSLDRGSEYEVTKDVVGVNMKTWQQQELDDLQLQICTLIAGIEVALKKCASVDSQCNHVLEMYNTNTEINNVLCDRGAFCNVRGLNLVERTNLIRDILTKLQGSEKNDAELVVVEDGQNPEDVLEMNPGAKSTILTGKEKAQKEHKKKASGHSVMLKMRLKLEQKLEQKTTVIEFLNTQNKSLQAVLDKEQNLKTEMERKLNKMKALHEALANEKEIACKLKFAGEEKCKQLEIELQKVSSVRQAYETLLEINSKLQAEIDDMKSKMDEEKKAIRHEYEKKLDKLKAKTKALYEEEVEKKTKKSKEESERLHAMCRFYKDKIWSYENDVGILKSQVWEIGDKLLLTEREKKKLEEELSKQEIFVQPIGKQDDFLDRHGAFSNLERGRKIAGSSREVHTLDIIDESITFVRRKKSVPRSLPSGMGAMFDPEDEEGEVFNTTNLADLKAGRCIPEGYKGRISELQYRNSLCPPHLKSSYPAETQFHDPREYRDEDLKVGCAVDIDHCDSLSTSMLLPSEKQRKRDRGQGTEVLTPRAPLRESNDGAAVRKVSTPSRLKSLFMTKNRRDENTPVTPRGRRLSNIFRRQVKNHL